MTYIIIFCLVSLSALFSGLTLGFFSLNKDDIERKAEIGDERAKKIYSVRENGNLLLCTLLIGNVAVNATLSIFLNSVSSGVMAGIISTALIVIFGEIIPQATFSRYALDLGAKVVWLVKIFVLVLYPICWPLSVLLDKILGDEVPTIYSKTELIKLIEDHEVSQESSLDRDEQKIIKGALSFSRKKVEDVMTPESEVFSLPATQKIDNKTLKLIFSAGHSRIPIYEEEKDDIIGLLYTKDLIILNHKKVTTTGELARRDVIFVDNEKPLDELLNAFQSKRHHLFVVISKYGSVLGIVTIEDVLEEIIGEEIVDEFDQHEDLREVAKKKMKKRNINKV